MRPLSSALAFVVLVGCSTPANEPAASREAKPEVVEAAEAAEVVEAVEEPIAAAPVEPGSEPKTEPDKLVPEPEPGLPVEPPAPLPTTLLVADKTGLHEVDLDGKRLATLARGAASEPRVLPDGRVVFLRKDSVGVAHGLWMFEPGGEPKLIANLPSRWNAEQCKVVFDPPGKAERRENEEDVEDELAGPDFDSLSLWAPGDFRLDPIKQEACLQLFNANENAANYGVMMRVSLSTGVLRQAANLDEDGCDEEVEPVDPPCYRLALERARPPASVATFAFSYEEESGQLEGPKGKSAKLCAVGEPEPECAGVEGRSPSGRFELLYGQVEGEDSLFRELVLLDRQDGKLWRLSSEPAVELVPTTVEQIFAEHDDWMGATISSDLRWLAQDRLWFDGMLIDPIRRKITKVGGDLAFQL